MFRRAKTICFAALSLFVSSGVRKQRPGQSNRRACFHPIQCFYRWSYKGAGADNRPPISGAVDELLFFPGGKFFCCWGGGGLGFGCATPARS